MVHPDWIKYQFFQHELILEAMKESYVDSNKTNLQKSYSASLNNIGYYNMNKGDLDAALSYFLKSLAIDKELKDSLAESTSLNNIGLIYKNKGDIETCLKYYHACLEIREILGYKKGIATSYHNIGAVYMEQKDDDKALEFCMKAKDIREEIGDKRGLSQSLNFVGFLHKNKEQYVKALEYWKKSLLIREEIGDLRGIAESVMNIGGIYRMQVRLISNGIGNKDSLVYNKEKALYYYNKSKDVYEKLGIKQGLSDSYYNIAEVQFYFKEKKASLKNATKALEIAQEIGFPETIKNAARLISKIYKSQGEGMKALEMFELYKLMQDSLLNDHTQKSVIKQQARYTYEKQKIKDDAEYEKMLAIEQEEKEKQQILTGASIGGLALVIVFLIFVFNRLRITKRQKIVIEEQKEEVEQANSELEEKNKEIMDSITYAKRIQSAILPPKKLVKEYLQDSFILYKPKDIVAGDFYWMEHKDGKVLFAAADCTGHGVPGAMVSVVCNNGLNRSVREHGLTDPGKILDKTREIVIQEFEKSEEEVKDGMDIALCSLEGSKLEYAGAHNPLWIIRDGEVIETKATKQPIGKFENMIPYTTHSFDLQKGDSIYVFSDGYVDQFGGEKGKKFKSRAFRDLLLSIQEKSMEEQRAIIDETFETWKGPLEQIDDVCVIGVRIQ
jgi:serine phosphatase RsbU (regulator of sigma subunit)